jgi:CTP:molybdopterin cytidylyltransferase MocA
MARVRLDSKSRFNALVLAADRTSNDAVAQFAGTPCKAAVLAGGQPMLLRVLDALAPIPGLDQIVVVGPSAVALAASSLLVAGLKRDRVARLEPESSPSRSAAAGISALGVNAPILITTADHALLTSGIAGEFLEGSRASGADLAVGLVRFATVQAAFPGVRRTVIRFQDDAFCTCNLFAVLTPAGSRVIEAWVKVEQQRKHPARLVAGILGPVALLRYVLGLLTLGEALSCASQRLGARIVPVILDEPEASVDVDTPDDLKRVEAILVKREKAAKG